MRETESDVACFCCGEVTRYKQTKSWKKSDRLLAAGVGWEGESENSDPLSK